MGNPPSRPEFRHTCPTCNRPVAPGYKFCEVCGTRIPSLFTCSKCGTQFIHPKKYCDLCGAHLIPEEIPEPETGEIPEPAVEEVQEPETDEIPEPDVENIPAPAEEEIPKHYHDEIHEPDTEELLEKYGAEYDENETLESYYKQKPTSPMHHDAKKPVTGPAPKGRGSSAAVDDALFFPDEGPVPAKPPVNKIRIIGGGIVLITVLAAVYFIGLPILTGNGGFFTSGTTTAAENTSIPEPTPAKTPSTLTVTPTAASGALVPLPTQVPAGMKFSFQV